MTPPSTSSFSQPQIVGTHVCSVLTDSDGLRTFPRVSLAEQHMLLLQHHLAPLLLILKTLSLTIFL